MIYTLLAATFSKAKQEFLRIVLLIIHQFKNVLMNKELFYD